MSRIQKRIARMTASRMMTASGPDNSEDGRQALPGPFSWYLTRPAAPDLRYALTTNGYVILL
jgi:hypothetical protein